MTRRVTIIFFNMLSRKRTTLLSLVIASLAILTSCNSEDATDCLQTDGEPITRSITLPDFTRVRIDNDISIEITQGPTQQITIETRANLWSDLTFKVENDTFIAQNNNDCNLLREYKQTTVQLTTPNLTFIKNNSIGEVRSIGTLNFPVLRLESITTPGLPSVNKSGDFILDLNCEMFTLAANGNSDFYITGSALMANISFSDEFPFLQGENFLIDDLTLRHAGAAPMIVHPINSIKGQIIATGDVIARNEPPNEDVVQLFTGRLIYQD